MLVAGIVSFLILIFIFAFVLKESIPGIREYGLFNLVFGKTWAPRYESYGFVALIVGTLFSTFIALVIAIPLSLSTAIFLAEVAPPRISQMARPVVELLVGIPSVVYGLVGLLFLAPLMADIDPGGGSGRSVLTAGIVLAVMILPTIAGITEDSIRAVPKHYKEASLALGANHWQTIWHVILPAARSGIIAAIILGIGRAIGETMAMIMVIGNTAQFPKSIFSSGYTLTGAIAQESLESYGLFRSVLFSAGLVLLVVIVLINLIAIIVHRRMAR
jgi:phosphate transport system permease protein